LIKVYEVIRYAYMREEKRRKIIVGESKREAGSGRY
jgi:hypothetical protein